MSVHELMMQRCIELAQNGVGQVSPNPLVGCVITHEDKIIGEGWHQKFGEAHAEVNAIASVGDKNLLSESTLYVNLEPCSHHGKTPPCADLIISCKIPRVVIGMQDPYHEVAGRGIQKLNDAGIEVISGVLQKECEWLNRKFIQRVTEHKPYVILKWAQTQDGFIAPDAAKLSPAVFEEKRHITGFIVQKLVHRWRTEEDAILVGTKTVITDNPALNARAWNGRNPIRVTLDKNLRIPPQSKIFDQSQPTFIFTQQQHPSTHNLNYITIDFNKDIWPKVFEALYKRGIQSVIVEGGLHTLRTLIAGNYWNEIQQFITPKMLYDGVQAPTFDAQLISSSSIDSSLLNVYIRA